MTLEERERLVRKATDLGIFLFGDDLNAWAKARSGALAAVRLLPHLIEQQKRRIRHKPSEPRRRLILSQDQLVQASTYSFADEPDDPPFRSRCIEYLKVVAHECLLGSSFDACILVNRFIYDLPVEGVKSFYELLTYGEDPKESRVVLDKEEQFFYFFKQRFQDLLRDSALEEEYRFVAEPLIDTSCIREYLVHFTPWNAHCRLPAGFDGSQRVEDLHGRGARQIIRSAKEEPVLEVNRVYALFEPEIHDIICTVLRLPSRFRIPKFHTQEEVI